MSREINKVINRKLKREHLLITSSKRKQKLFQTKLNTQMT